MKVDLIDSALVSRFHAAAADDIASSDIWHVAHDVHVDFHSDTHVAEIVVQRATPSHPGYIDRISRRYMLREHRVSRTRPIAATTRIVRISGPDLKGWGRCLIGDGTVFI